MYAEEGDIKEEVIVMKEPEPTLPWAFLLAAKVPQGTKKTAVTIQEPKSAASASEHQPV